MPKGYFLSAHRAEANEEKKAAYNNLARAALEGAGGTVIAIARPGAKLVAHENGVEQSTVLIEFNSYEAALAAYDCPAYQKALEALDNGADRDIRIFEGL
jgi:uncharacterized protein (DUF1330 family)